MLGLSDRKNINAYIAYSPKPGFLHFLALFWLMGGAGHISYVNIMDQEAINLGAFYYPMIPLRLWALPADILANAWSSKHWRTFSNLDSNYCPIKASSFKFALQQCDPFFCSSHPACNHMLLTQKSQKLQVEILHNYKQKSFFKWRHIRLNQTSIHTVHV